MKKVIAPFLAFTIILLSILIYKTYTFDKICGWNGEDVKNWPCVCLGIKGVPVNDHVGRWTVFHCTGLNLSCSEFALKYLHGNNKQKPSDCGKATLNFK